jgi:purine-cytosine permease-like protein
MTFLWIILAVLYITLWVTLGMRTLRKGHTALFWIGIIFPVLWIVGVLMEPTPAVAAAESRERLR